MHDIDRCRPAGNIQDCDHQTRGRNNLTSLLLQAMLHSSRACKNISITVATEILSQAAFAITS